MNEHANVSRSRAIVAAGPRPQAIVPTDFEAVQRLSQCLVDAGLLPHGVKTASQVSVALMHGLEVGLPPMAALQRIAVINGRPTIWGDAAIGLVRNSGLSEYIKEWVEGDGDARTAHCESRRRDDPEPVHRSFSVADARRARLWDERARVKRRRRDGGGDYETDNDSPWYRFPDRMLQMRARGWCLRDLYSDVLVGLYLKEEIDDEPDMIDVTPTGEQNAARLSEQLAGAREDKQNFDAAAVVEQADAMKGDTAARDTQPDYGALLRGFADAIGKIEAKNDLNAFVETYGTRDGEEWFDDAPDDIKAEATRLAGERWDALDDKPKNENGVDHDAGDGSSDGQADPSDEAAASHAGDPPDASDGGAAAASDEDEDDGEPVDSDRLQEFDTLLGSCTTAAQIDNAFDRVSSAGGWYAKGSDDLRATTRSMVERHKARLAPAVAKAPAKPKAGAKPKAEAAKYTGDPQVLADAEKATAKGVKGFKLWTGKLTQQQFDALGPELKRLEAMAKKADEL